MRCFESTIQKLEILLVVFTLGCMIINIVSYSSILSILSIFRNNFWFMGHGYCQFLNCHPVLNYILFLNPNWAYNIIGVVRMGNFKLRSFLGWVLIVKTQARGYLDHFYILIM